jgi:hypothetical protein
MKWEKLGCVWAPRGDVAWAQTHAQLPVAHPIDNDRWNVYVSTRDSRGKSRVGRVEVRLGHRPDATSFDAAPALDLGEPGTFDDSGVMASCVIAADERLSMYYIGWNVGDTVPYRLSIGLATSVDGVTFHRASQGPIIDRSMAEPYFVTTPCVLRDDSVWRMYYSACTGWRTVDGRMEPLYHVKQATSPDGVHWNVTGESSFAPLPDEAIARPCVFRVPGGYAMLFSTRSVRGYRNDRAKGYRIGYAESPDGVRWTRRDELAGIGVADEGWDSQMIEYCWVQRHGDQTYLLYNGDGFGATGFGVARLVP